MQTLNIGMVALNPTVGDLKSNSDKILAFHRDDKENDLIVFPECSVTGYPLEDLLYKRHLLEDVKYVVEEHLAPASKNSAGMIVGAPWLADNGNVYNAAILLADGQVKAVRYKRHLPNYDVFDEVRYFKAGELQPPVNFKGFNLGLAICEDIWYDDVVRYLTRMGSDAIIAINGSPWDTKKNKTRFNVIAQRSTDNNIPLLYINQLGGQDELVFDGGAYVAINKDIYVMPQWQESNFSVQLSNEGLKSVHTKTTTLFTEIDSRALVYQYEHDSNIDDVYEALKLGLRDYVDKNNFPGVVLGLSGGVDSALAATIAVDALGPSRVHAVMMPAEHTSEESISLAAELANNLGIRYDVIAVGEIVESQNKALSELFAGREQDVTEENIQARVRGVTLMAISNKFGYMVLTTGNKSEMSVGYSTLYGDMVGGFNVLKDVYKTDVFNLCNWRNMQSDTDIIPKRIISRPPSAELAAGQKDEDSLPDYYTLDYLLQSFIEKEMHLHDVDHKGSTWNIPQNVVEKVRYMIDRNEYKRRQAAPGVRISHKSLAGRDRRYPITNHYKDHVDSFNRRAIIK